MIPRIKHFETLAGLLLEVEFDDGRVVVYDAGEDVRDIPSYALFETLPGLFAQAQLGQSRTCVFWNDEVGLPSDAICEFGRELVPVACGARWR